MEASTAAVLRATAVVASIEDVEARVINMPETCRNDAALLGVPQGPQKRAFLGQFQGFFQPVIKFHSHIEANTTTHNHTQPQVQTQPCTIAATITKQRIYTTTPDKHTINLNHQYPQT
jgi:hypothetical protein